MGKEDNSEDKAKKTEKDREIALKNLKASNLTNIAAAYFVDESGQFGEAGNAAMEQYKYFPAFKNGIKAYNSEGEEYDVFQNSMLSSRENGKRYTGNITERKIMNDCASIVQESLDALTIKDIIELMGSKEEIAESYQKMYVKDLLPKKSKEEMENATDEEKKKMKESAELYKTLVGSYQTYLATKMVSEALGESAKQIPKNLEKILMEDKEESEKLNKAKY